MFYIWIGNKFDSQYDSLDETMQAVKELEDMGYIIKVLNDDGKTVYKSEV